MRTSTSAPDLLSPTELSRPRGKAPRLDSRVGVVASLLYVGTLVWFERELILEIADPGARPPSLFWQLLWPTALLAFSFFLTPTLCWLFLGLTGWLSIAILACDAAYFEFFSTVTSMVMYGSFHQLFDVRDSVFNLLSPERLLPAVLFLPFFFLAARSWRRRGPGDLEVTDRKGSWRRRSRIWGAVLIAANIAMGSIAWQLPIYEDTHHPHRDKWVKPAEHWNSRYSRSSYASTFGVFNYHVMDLVRVIERAMAKDHLDDARRDAIKRVLVHKKRLNARKSPLWGIARGRHVVILQLESLQHFLLDLKVREHEVTPTLNRLRKTAFTWDNIVDVTYVGRSSDAEFAALTGLLPDARMPAASYGLSDSLVALPKVLKKHGYTTSSVHGLKREFWNAAYTHPAYGIEEMHFGERFRGSKKVGLGPSDRDVFSYAVELLQSRRLQQQFLFVISLSSHHPYLYVDQKYLKPYSHLLEKGQVVGKEYGVAAPYLASASYTDEVVGEFFDALERRSLLKESLIVIYGDHDRGNLAGDSPIPEVGPRMYSLTEDRIPMILLVPGEEELIARHGRQFLDVTGGLQDLAPTLLHLLGEEIPLGMLGTHLFVNNDLRDPVPIPTAPGLFAYRGNLVLPGGKVVPLGAGTQPPDSIPSRQEALVDQLAVQDLLDHYDDIVQADESDS